MPIYPAPNPMNYDTPYAPDGMMEVPPMDAGGTAPTPAHYKDSVGNIYAKMPVSQTIYQSNKSVPDDSAMERVSIKIAKSAPDGGFASPAAYMRTLTQKTIEAAREQGIDINSGSGRDWYAKTMDAGKKEMGVWVDSSDKTKFMALGKDVVDLRTGRRIHTSPETQIEEEYLKKLRGETSPSTQPAPGGPQSYNGQPKPQGMNISPEMAAMSPTLGKIQENRMKQEKHNLETGAGMGAGQGGPGSLDKGQVDASGKFPDVISSLSPAKAQIVQNLTDYKLPLPSGAALKTPYWQSALETAALYDPSFDASQYKVRQDVKKDFTSGKSSNAIKSLNTVIGHLDTLDQKGSALDNSSFQLWNRVKNSGSTQFGDKKVTEFDAAATAVENELANVFKNTGATDQEIKAWKQSLASYQSPEQLKGAITTAVELIGSRMQALQSSYERGLGKPVDFKFLTEKSENTLKKLLSGDASQTSQATQAGPPVISTKAEYDKLPSGATYISKNGQPHRKP